MSEYGRFRPLSRLTGRALASLSVGSELLRGWFKVFCLRPQLAYMGRDVAIDPTVTLNWPGKIHLADECRLYRGAYLNARTTREIGIKLGRGVKIHEYTYVDPYGGYIWMDDYSGVGHHCVIGGHGGLRVGKHSMIGGLTYIVPANHIFATTAMPYIEQGETRQGIVIGENVWVGASCVILDGVSIGDNAVIGAGSIVTHDIPANCLAFGAPARSRKMLHGTYPAPLDESDELQT